MGIFNTAGATITVLALANSLYACDSDSASSNSLDGSNVGVPNPSLPGSAGATSGTAGNGNIGGAAPPGDGNMGEPSPSLVARGDGTYADASGNITDATGNVLLENNGDGTFSAADGTVVRVDGDSYLDLEGEEFPDTDGDGLPDIIDTRIGMDAERPEIPVDEIEDESSFLAPVITGDIVWSANPVSGRVALINAATRGVRTVSAGQLPTYLTAIRTPSGTPLKAAVLNVGSGTATFFSATDSAVTDVSVDVPEEANSWTVSKDGHWAIAWTNHRRIERELANAEGFQDVTVVDLRSEPLRATRLAVGYRPVKLEITDDESAAFAVTGQGITEIALGDSPASLDDVLIDTPPEAGLGGFAPEDVAITRDGRFAVVRHAGTNVASVLDLSVQEQVSLEFASSVTDIDVSADGRTGLVVLRQTSEVVLFELADVVQDTTALRVVGFGEEVIGSAVVAEQGNTAVFYTNAVPNPNVSVLNFLDGTTEQRTLNLRVPVSAVFVAPDASHALAFLEPEQGALGGALGVVPLQSNLPPKVLTTMGVPEAVAISATDSGVRGLITTVHASIPSYGVQLVQMPSMQTDGIALPGAPLAVGIMAERNLGYVAQSHPEGLITFIDLDTAATHTLTGFEIAARVVDGSER